MMQTPAPMQNIVLSEMPLWFSLGPYVVCLLKYLMQASGNSVFETEKEWAEQGRKKKKPS